jgi:hypothetical protein
MKTETAKFKFKVPSGHPDAGATIEREFSFPVCEKEDEAAIVAAEKKVTFLSLVNDLLKMQARSNTYQTATLPYRGKELSEDDAKEGMVRNMIRRGYSEAEARERVELAFA